MKKKIVTIMLCFALSISCAMPVIASEASEVTTTETVKEGMETSKKKLKKKLKKKYALKFHKEVPNDATGNWRWAEYESDTGFEQFAADYYKAFVKDDSEIHMVINRKTNLIYRLNCIYKLRVTSFEYTPGEENDAKTLLSGKNPIIEYEIDPYYEEGQSKPVEQDAATPLDFVPCTHEQQALVTSINFMDGINEALLTAGIPTSGAVVTEVGNYEEAQFGGFFTVDFKIETADGHILLAECPTMPGDNYAFVRSIKDMNTGHAYYDDGGGTVYDYATDTVSDGPIKVLYKYQ